MRVLLLFLPVAVSIKWDDLELNPVHLKYLLTTDEKLLNICKEDSSCPIKIDKPRCWGYEENCNYENSYSGEQGFPVCDAKSTRELFWKQADWGYVHHRGSLFPICTSNDQMGSTLLCNKYLQHCYAKNIFIDLRHFDIKGSLRYRNDIIREGDVGGNCQSEFYENILKGNLQQKSYLQSWAHELEHFNSSAAFKVDSSNCDLIFEKPTIVQKQDAAVNMYHHFCDFVNLYASQHINGSFDRNTQIIWWDTAQSGFGDSIFGVTWQVFSNKKPLELISLAGKRVCFKEVMFPLLARQPYGLYYNMPLTQNCAGSGLIHSFVHHALFRLGIPPSQPNLETVRVTILSRSTAFRKILNIHELADAVRSLPGVHLRIVDYNHGMAFVDQLTSTHSSDVFIGIHGAGLTHLLFLPDWAAIFELYHCEDRGCYRDLARLRGLKYFTWPDDKLHLIVPDNRDENRQKFVNHNFDATEFKSQVQKMVEWVRRHPKFVEVRRQIRRNMRKQEL